MLTIEILTRKSHKSGEGAFFVARTRVDGAYFSETGDTEEEALGNLRSAIDNATGVVLPDRYPKIVEVDW